MLMQQTPPEKVTEAVQNGGPEEVVTPSENLSEADQLVHELDKLLHNYKPLVELDDMGEQLQNLKSLSETYRDGVAAGDTLAREGSACVADLRERTKLAAEELQRLADDGGPPPTKEQQAQIEVLAKAARKLDKIAPVIERHFGDKEESGSEKAAQDAA